MKNTVLFILLFTLIINVKAQPSMIPPANAPLIGSIKGRIVENGSNVPLEYANIAIFSESDSTLAGGGIANAKGEFLVSGLKPGKYYIDAKFIGYNHTKKEDIQITFQMSQVDLGTIELNPASENLDEVNVYAQDKPIIYDIDKKIIDPAQFPTAANGTATDVLANTPSVVVDIEGNVSMRGSSNFTVLIDGRPTPFEGADALEQIPASTIRNIEIITNPSAKYDPDGNAGIININTKKSKITGVSGIVNASGDTNGSLSGDFLLNFKREKINYFVSANYSNRKRVGQYESLSKTFNTSDTLTTESVGENDGGFKGWSAKTGFDYYINDFNTLSFNVGLNGRNRYSNGISNFHEYSTSGKSIYSLNEDIGEGKGERLSLGLDYRKTFERKGQELTAYMYYDAGSNADLSLYNQYIEQNNIDSLISGQKNWEEGDNKRFRFKTDYVHPFNDKTKLEAGYQLRIGRNLEWNDVYWYNQENDYEPSPQSENYSETYFQRDIHSVYTTFSNSGPILGVQLGLRGEYTNRRMDFSKANQNDIDIKPINRFDIFPTLHFSFQLPWQQQLIASYSRRIDRPRGYYLEPFITYIDAYNVRSGNPNIEPEYIDSYELGYQKQIHRGFISAEIYHRKTNNKIERVQSVFSDNVILQTVDNVGADYSTGLELMINTNPTKWWMLNIMGNAYHYAIDGNINEQAINMEPSFNWHARFSNIFSVGKTTKLQFDGMYHSPTNTAQGSREGFMFTSLAVRQDLFDNKLNLTLSVRDVFDTAKFGFESSGKGFYTSRNFDMKSPVVSLSLSYKINNYRQKRGVQNTESYESEEMNMDMNMGGMEM